MDTVQSKAMALLDATDACFNQCVTDLESKELTQFEEDCAASCLNRWHDAKDICFERAVKAAAEKKA